MTLVLLRTGKSPHSFEVPPAVAAAALAHDPVAEGGEDVEERDRVPRHHQVALLAAGRVDVGQLGPHLLTNHS